VIDTKATGRRRTSGPDELEKSPRRAIRCADAQCAGCLSIASTSVATRPVSSRLCLERGRRMRAGRWTASRSRIASPAPPRRIQLRQLRRDPGLDGRNDIKARTGRHRLNMVVKRGTNQYRGSVRGYLTTSRWNRPTCRTS
jgi:hypothetical protein